MFCYQCEQTAGGTGCTKIGVCGKEPQVAALQDALTYALQGLAVVATAARAKGVTNRDADRFLSQGLFATLTNVNFDPERFPEFIHQAVNYRDSLKAKVPGTSYPEGVATFQPASDLPGLVAQGEEHGFLSEEGWDPDCKSLRDTVIFGLRGLAAYADHASILGQEDEAVFEFLTSALAATTDKTIPLGDWVGLALKTGEVNLRAMELLDAGNTGRFGHPVPTPVPLGHKKGKAILVSGHDLEDLHQLLEQTRGKGIYVYTHGEMLPTHGYPELKKYENFYGHYGTAWQNQGKEFPAFPGAILMTTN
ncbi:MAG: hydroxylamine reductase, partial [Deltaproteobacteria bacterium]|nr:hydroxylamine reductase [Deltaproteobacteria bacterium]